MEETNREDYRETHKLFRQKSHLAATIALLEATRTGAAPPSMVVEEHADLRGQPEEMRSSALNRQNPATKAL